ncbi:hypothetical protein R1flu_025695 [Riccia fluitans]|uniref:Uncharacterized protein n=1 Tax=Riccia fluitans TaxID=41844 RepID=A0ABD1XYH3_9MARC
MQNIDILVEALEMEARESKMSKHRKLFSDEPSSSTLQVYQPLERSIVPSFLNFGITLKELSTLSRDEVFPYVNTQRLKTDGIVKISSGIFQPTRSSIGTTFEYIMDLFATSLRKLVDFLVKGECHKIVPPSKVKAEFLKRTGRKYKKDAWQDIASWFGFSLTHSQPCSEGWLMDDFKKFSLEGHPDGYALDKQIGIRASPLRSEVILGHGSNDKFSEGKFREGWQAIVRIICADFLARQATTRHEHEPLLLEARNANTGAEWDNEKGELVHEREALKEKLNKAKEMVAKAKEMVVEVEQRMEAIRLKKEALQQ